MGFFLRFKIHVFIILRVGCQILCCNERKKFLSFGFLFGYELADRNLKLNVETCYITVTYVHFKCLMLYNSFVKIWLYCVCYLYIVFTIHVLVLLERIAFGIIWCIFFFRDPLLFSPCPNPY